MCNGLSFEVYKITDKLVYVIYKWLNSFSPEIQICVFVCHMLLIKTKTVYQFFLPLLSFFLKKNKPVQPVDLVDPS